MGCVSSALLNQQDEFSQIGSSSLGHHIVSLTSSTYGLLSLDPPPSFPINLPPPPRSLRSDPATAEIINSWELMAGLDPIANDSFRFPTHSKPEEDDDDKENSNPNVHPRDLLTAKNEKNKSSSILSPAKNMSPSLDGYPKLCPPGGEEKVVVYTTSLRMVRQTFEACNAVKAAIQGMGVAVCERDISMDGGFREELRELLKEEMIQQRPPLPRVFVKGRYLGGAEELMRIAEKGWLGELLQGMPRLEAGLVCEGCGGVRFVPCLCCNGSCKKVVVMMTKEIEKGRRRSLQQVVRCPECNENGLMLCPICSSSL